jgi:hypothetical protein
MLLVYAGDGDLVRLHGRAIIAVHSTKPSREIDLDNTNEELIYHLEHVSFYECLVSLSNNIS